MSDGHWNSDREIEQAQLRSFARSIAGVEWLLLLLVVLYLFVIRPEAIRELVIVAALLGFAAILLAARFAPRLRAEPALKISLEIVAMIVFLTVVLNQTGPEASLLLNLYLLPIIAAALVLGRRRTILAVVLVCLCYFLLVSARPGAQAFSPELVTRAATVLVPFLLVAFLTSALAENIHTATRRIRALSARDSLTGLLNIGAFMRLAERRHRQAASTDDVYSILLVDIDHLKQINQAYGHGAGNKALTTVAEGLLRVTQSEDLVARFGGEEFVICLPNKELTAATELAQRLRNLVYASTFEVNADIVRIQVSVGVASFPIDGDTLEHVMRAADRAMYKDKELRTRPEGRLVIQKR